VIYQSDLDGESAWAGFGLQTIYIDTIIVCIVYQGNIPTEGASSR